jgi:hypothetical protein
MNVSVGSRSMWKEHGRVWTAVAGLGALLVAFALYLALAGGTSESAAAVDEALPATVQYPNGSEVALLTLQPRAIKRLDLRTVAITSERVGGKARMSVPYGAVIYDSEGATWVYVANNPRSFMRKAITIDRITGDGRVILSAGPAAGTKIATVGAQELWGAELGIDSGSH